MGVTEGVVCSGGGALAEGGGSADGCGEGGAGEGGAGDGGEEGAGGEGDAEGGGGGCDTDGELVVRAASEVDGVSGGGRASGALVTGSLVTGAAGCLPVPPRGSTAACPPRMCTACLLAVSSLSDVSISATSAKRAATGAHRRLVRRKSWRPRMGDEEGG